MQVLIVDDEPLACQRLAKLISQIKGFEAITEFAHYAGQAYELTQKYRPDIVLLDIKLPQISGLQVAANLCVLEHAPAIIFCTAYDEFALEAFKVNAVDYLLKPIRIQHLTAALIRATTLNLAQVNALQPDNQPQYISVKSKQGIIKIKMADILYLSAEHKYVTLHHQNGELILDDTLKALEDKYSDYLIRIHRHTLVVRSQIASLHKNKLGGGKLRLHNLEREFAVSRRCFKNVSELLLKQELD